MEIGIDRSCSDTSEDDERRRALPSCRYIDHNQPPPTLPAPIGGDHSLPTNAPSPTVAFSRRGEIPVENNPVSKRCLWIFARSPSSISGLLHKLPPFEALQRAHVFVVLFPIQLLAYFVAVPYRVFSRVWHGQCFLSVGESSLKQKLQIRLPENASCMF